MSEKEHKVRVWDTKKKRFVAISDLKFPYIGYKYLALEKSRYIPVEYTGLKDMNDKEIWEGDIIKGKALGIAEYLKPIVWGAVTLYDGQFYGGSMPLSRIENREIIGNIYENPELLKEANHG